jgi:hypothetical protein
MDRAKLEELLEKRVNEFIKKFSKYDEESTEHFFVQWSTQDGMVLFISYKLIPIDDEEKRVIENFLHDISNIYLSIKSLSSLNIPVCTDKYFVCCSATADSVRIFKRREEL